MRLKHLSCVLALALSLSGSVFAQNAGIFGLNEPFQMPIKGVVGSSSTLTIDLLNPNFQLDQHSIPIPLANLTAQSNGGNFEIQVASTNSSKLLHPTGDTIDYSLSVVNGVTVRPTTGNAILFSGGPGNGLVANALNLILDPFTPQNLVSGDYVDTIHLVMIAI